MAFALSFVNRRVRIISGNKKEVKSCLRTAREEDGPDLVARWLRFAFFISGGCVSISTLNQKCTAQISVP